MSRSPPAKSKWHDGQRRINEAGKYSLLTNITRWRSCSGVVRVCVNRIRPWPLRRPDWCRWDAVVWLVSARESIDTTRAGASGRSHWAATRPYSCLKLFVCCKFICYGLNSYLIRFFKLYSGFINIRNLHTWAFDLQQIPEILAVTNER